MAFGDLDFCSLHSKVKTMVPWCGPLIWNPSIPVVDHIQNKGPYFKTHPNKVDTDKGPYL